MGPDQAFAAHMWTWPDAAIKRDASGAVLFVNAAFLAIYGGRAEDWHGMAVAGWTAPPQAGQSVRFETRIPVQLPHMQGERVFDWIESAMADGSALAIARDVSDIVAPQGGEPIAQPAQSPGLETSFAEGAHVPGHAPAEAATAPAAQPAFEPVMEQPAHVAAPLEWPEAAQVAIPDAQAHTPPQQEPTPVLDTAPVVDPAPVIQEQVPVEPAPETPTEPPAPAPAASEPVSAAAPVDDFGMDDFDDILDVGTSAPVQTPIQATAPEAPAREPETPREFERRALPVEDSSAVLGTNWRDAVIAKAVGVGEDTPEAAPSEPAPAATPATPRVAGDAIRILLAEDNAINALLTRTLLEAEGCVVDTVEDGALAVEAVKAKPYDLIFMDMRMPNMDGLGATRKIRSMDHASKGLPIVALTANAFDDDRNACFDAGMNDFMTKPVSAEELSEMVARWTGENAEQLQAATA